MTKPADTAKGAGESMSGLREMTDERLLAEFKRVAKHGLKGLRDEFRTTQECFDYMEAVESEVARRLSEAASIKQEPTCEGCAKQSLDSFEHDGCFVDKVLDKEMGRWQAAIYALCRKEAIQAEDIDGSGCDSGDPLDLTLAEVGQLACQLKNPQDYTSSEAAIAGNPVLAKYESARFDVLRLLEEMEQHGGLDAFNEQRVEQVHKKVAGFATLLQLAAEGQKAKKALHDLTPGGSEFVNDVPRCVEWIRERFAVSHRQVLEAVKARHAAEREGEQAKAELAEAQRLNRVAERAFQMQDAVSIPGRAGELNCLQISKAWLELEKRAESAEAALVTAREVAHGGCDYPSGGCNCYCGINCAPAEQKPRPVPRPVKAPPVGPGSLSEVGRTYLPEQPRQGKWPIDRPCSACSDGDYEMKHHLHDWPPAEGVAAQSVENSSRCRHCQAKFEHHSVYHNRCFTGYGEGGIRGLRETSFEPDPISSGASTGEKALRSEQAEMASAPQPMRVKEAAMEIIKTLRPTDPQSWPTNMPYVIARLNSLAAPYVAGTQPKPIHLNCPKCKHDVLSVKCEKCDYDFMGNVFDVFATEPQPQGCGAHPTAIHYVKHGLMHCAQCEAELNLGRAGKMVNAFSRKIHNQREHIKRIEAKLKSTPNGVAESGAAQGTPQVEEIAREICEALAKTKSNIHWMAIVRGILERSHLPGAPAKPGPEETDTFYDECEYCHAKKPPHDSACPKYIEFETAAAQSQAWVRVEERLPEKDGFVQVRDGRFIVPITANFIGGMFFSIPGCETLRLVSEWRDLSAPPTAQSAPDGGVLGCRKCDAGVEHRACELYDKSAEGHSLQGLEAAARAEKREKVKPSAAERTEP